MSVLVLDNIVIPGQSDGINELVGGDDVIIWREFRTVVIKICQYNNIKRQRRKMKMKDSWSNKRNYCDTVMYKELPEVRNRFLICWEVCCYMILELFHIPAYYVIPLH